jgi:hypothetical protein
MAFGFTRFTQNLIINNQALFFERLNVFTQESLHKCFPLRARQQKDASRVPKHANCCTTQIINDQGFGDRTLGFIREIM